MHRDILRPLRRLRFPGSGTYWERRYAKGGTSGPGSYGDVSRFKADVLNSFVRANRVESVVELGCGDGHQLALTSFPRYVGLDVSKTAIRVCMSRFAEDATKSFIAYDPEAFCNRGAIEADLSLSLDVIYHLVEEGAFNRYMGLLFGSARNFVGIFSTDAPVPERAAHIRHRQFTSWVMENAPEWRLYERVDNPHKGPESIADFYFFARRIPGSEVSSDGVR